MKKLKDDLAKLQHTKEDNEKKIAEDAIRMASLEEQMIELVKSANTRDVCCLS